MRVKYKILIIFIISTIMVVMLTSSIACFICNNYINGQEESNVSKGFESVNSIIEKEESNMKSRVLDYAHWNDTYEFVKDHNSNYIESNYSGNNLEVLNLNLAIYLDESGSNIFNKTNNLSYEESETLIKDILRTSNKFNKLSNYKNVDDVKLGLLFSSDKLYMVACSPITVTGGKSGSNGILIFARVVDKPFLDYISEITPLKLEFFDKINSSIIKDENLIIPDNSFDIKKTPDSIKAYKLLKNVEGEETIIYSISQDRSAYNAGIYYFETFSLVFWIIMLVMILVDYYILNKYILNRIRILHEFMESVSSTKNTKAVIDVAGRDEISELAITANKMLSRLDNASKEISLLSYSDKLTGLKNRTFIEKKLREIDSQKDVGYSIILCDLNGLKLISDTFGRNEGDKLLCTITNILISVCSHDDIIARWGGDEFIILTIGKERFYTDDIINKIKEACYNVKDIPLKFSIALGSAEKNDKYSHAEAVMNLAEERMYRNKLLDKNSSRSSTIISLERSLYEKHSETEEHTIRIKKLCSCIAKKLGLPQEKIDELELLGMLHDIGKIGIPENILMKPGKLTNDEWEIMKSHTEIGYRIAIATPELAHIANEILHHHERFDGNGYPQGLKGTEIPLFSRIINTIDSFDVMTHSRCYKEAMSIDDAIEELRRCSGTQFDPHIVEIFVDLLIKG